MLGQASLKLGNGGMALQAYRRAYQLEPDNADTQIIYAKLLTRSNNPHDIQDATDILEKIIAANPNNLDALSALAMKAFNQNRFNDAIIAWEKVIALSPPNAKNIDMIKKSLIYAKSKIATNDSKLSIMLILSPDMQKYLPAKGNILITVTDGKSPVPVAVKKLMLDHLPFEFTLDDHDAMMPTRLLSALKRIKVTATITNDDATDKNQMFGESEIFSYNDKETINLTIKHLTP